MVKKLNIFYLYLLGDTVLIAISLYFGELWLLNSQVAFIVSLIIIFSSYFGYKKFINSQVPHVILEDKEEEDERFLDKPKKITKHVGISLSPLRILSYIFLILSFFFLNRHEHFLPMAFLAGLSVVPIMTLLASLFSKNHQL